MKHGLTTYIDAHQQDMIQHLADFVAIPSVSSDREQVKEALAYALQLGQTMGFRVESCLDGQVGVIEAGEGEETLGILSHVDVVPAGDAEDWDSDPFQLRQEDGRLYGRGTIDDKGMIIASLYAMKAVMETGKPFHKRVQLILGTQEEVEWTDMDAYVQQYPLPDYGFSPDGEYPICNVEKGTADFTLEFDLAEDLAPSSDQKAVIAIDCGVAQNSVPGKATATLSNGETITALGKAVHSCQPERGENALFNLCSQLQAQEVADNRLMQIVTIVTEAFSDIYGEGIGLRSESEYYQGEFVHRNAFSPTIFTTKGDKAIVNINCRFPYGMAEDELTAGIEAFAARAGGKVTAIDLMPAVFVSQERPFLSCLAEAYEDVTGLQNEFTLAYGGSYAKAMPNVVSWGPLFPGEEDTCHEVNEYIDLQSMLNSTKIFAQAIASIVFAEESLR